MSFCYEQQINDPTVHSLLKVDFLLPLQHQKILLQKETVLRLWDTEMNWCNYVDVTFLYACALQRQLPFCHSEGTHGGY